jgi:toxin ParE1/3/4
MNEPRLTLQAEADLEELWAYIAANNPDAADRMVDAVLEASRMHVRFPGIGQKRDDLRPGLRCFVVSPYVVFYRPIEDTIEVLRILHGARHRQYLRLRELTHPLPAVTLAPSVAAQFNDPALCQGTRILTQLVNPNCYAP